MNLENVAYFQVIIAKKFYSQVIIVNHINSHITPTLLSNITPQIPLFSWA
jgi:hypothetical protein